MLSRVAERIYWFARYLERAENTARIVNVNAHLLLDLPRRVPLGWQPLIDITGGGEAFASLNQEPSEQNVVRFLVADPRNPDSLLSSLNSARENARTIRDVIPREAWEGINEFFLEMKSALPTGLARSRRFDLLRSAITRNQQLTGLLAGSMLHDVGYEFLRIGRNLERADMTTRIVDVRSASLLPSESEELLPFGSIQWASVLRSLSAYQSYTQKVAGPVRREAVLQFLLQELSFPRSFAHCVAQIRGCMQRLPHNDDPMRFVNRITRTIKRAKPSELNSERLHKFTDQLQLNLARLNDLISRTYFTLAKMVP